MKFNIKGKDIWVDTTGKYAPRVYDKDRYVPITDPELLHLVTLARAQGRIGRNFPIVAVTVHVHADDKQAVRDHARSLNDAREPL